MPDELLKTIHEVETFYDKGTYVKSIFMSSYHESQVFQLTPKSLKIFKTIRNDKRSKNRQVIETLTAELARAKTLYLTDIAGLRRRNNDSIETGLF